MDSAYGEDLAYIHDAGFGSVASSLWDNPVEPRYGQTASDWMLSERQKLKVRPLGLGT